MPFLPTNHAERVFLDVSVAVIAAVVLLLVVVAVVRRRRQRGNGRWWQGPYAEDDQATPSVSGRRDQ